MGTLSGVNVFTETISGNSGTGFSASYLNGVFGDGSDGDVSIVAGSPVVLSRDMMYNNLTIPNGATLKPRGFHIFVKNTLTIDAGGNINDNGNNGVGINGGAGLAAVSTGFGAGSGSGANGRTTTGAGSVSAASTNCSLNDLNQAPQGGSGGNASGSVLGAGPGAAPPPTVLQKWSSLASMWTARAYNGTWNGGSGGGSGGCDATAGASSSGGGGGAAGIVWIGAKTISNSGSITCNGGKGADGVTTLGAAGGGGGGAGGLIGIITATNTSLGTTLADGGLGGTSVGGTSTPGSVGKVGCIASIILS
jgi:hypothetical protein